MENIIASNLSKHLNRHNVLHELQHGFREKRSCETQLIQIGKAAIFGKTNGFNTFGFYFMHNQELEYVDAAKYKGVTISNTHINNITSNANKTLGFVKRNVITKKDIKTMAYNTLVHPHVEYASAVWSPYTKENINKIEKVQRRAARWVSNDNSTYSRATLSKALLKSWRLRSVCFLDCVLLVSSSTSIMSYVSLNLCYGNPCCS